MRESGIVSASLQEEERQFEAALRPRRLADFTGQAKLKENLSIAIEAARKRGEALDHVLLYGPPGLGQDDARRHHRRRAGRRVQQTSGPVLQKKLDLTGILSNVRARRSSSSTKSIACCRTWRRCSIPRWRISASTS